MTYSRPVTVLAAVLVFSAVCVQGSSPGQLDFSFAPVTKASPDGTVLGAIPQADGRILIVGSFQQLGGVTFRGFGQLNPDGSLDASFNPGTGADGIVNCAAIQADGKPLIGGTFQAINAVAMPKMARVNPDGSLDSSFHAGFGLDGAVNAITIQADGLILVGGAFALRGHTNLVRLQMDGSLDETFSPRLSPDGIVNAILVQGDQRVVICGAFTNFNAMPRNRIVRLTAAGSLDATFDPGLGANGPIYAAYQKADGGILVGGRFSSLRGSSRNFLGEFNADGSLSAALASAGANDAIYALSDDDGGILLGGRFTAVEGQPCGRVARLLSDGSLDLHFQPGSGANDAIYCVSAAAGSKSVFEKSVKACPAVPA